MESKISEEDDSSNDLKADYLYYTNKKYKPMKQNNYMRSMLQIIRHQLYVEYVQIGQKQNCIMLIKAGDTMHEGRHVCSITTDKQFHTCDCRCPDCNALCILQYGHRGKHSTQQHRNKDSQIYTLIIGEQITSEKESRFKIGDSSKIENCTQYCERKGRGHFHIVECKGGFECLEKKHREKLQRQKIHLAKISFYL